MTDNITDMAEFRRRFQETPPAREYVVRENGDKVALAVMSPVIELHPEAARKLAEELIDTADLIEDNQ